MEKRILIVDDEHAIRDSLARRYRLKGWQVETAENGRAAIEILDTIPFRVVISDIVMPEMDGVELLRRIQADFPMTRVIMITGYVTLENALACLRHGADTVVFKPLTDLSELDQAIDEAFVFLEKWEKKLSRLIGMKDKSK